MENLPQTCPNIFFLSLKTTIKCKSRARQNPAIFAHTQPFTTV